MNRIRSGFFLFVLSALTACGSQPVKDQYYSLVLAADDTPAPVTVEKPTKQIIVGPIQLARYLTQPGLAMQTGASQILVANHHFWAEPLDEAIGKVLVRDISQQVNAVAVDRAGGRWTQNGDCQLRVEFDKFHATENSQVVTTGRYWIHESNDTRKREFDIVRRLSTDGYAHAVHQLRATLATLAGEIVKQMSIDGTCL